MSYTNVESDFFTAYTVLNTIVGFEVLTAVSTKIAVFWVVATCSLVEVYQRFRGTCCLHHGPMIMDYE
jgi:hypothetical protein